jgi:hypothetical protein
MHLLVPVFLGSLQDLYHLYYLVHLVVLMGFEHLESL